jgi:hypothetical protein
VQSKEKAVPGASRTYRFIQIGIDEHSGAAATTDIRSVAVEAKKAAAAEAAEKRRLEGQAKQAAAAEAAGSAV